MKETPNFTISMKETPKFLSCCPFIPMTWVVFQYLVSLHNIYTCTTHAYHFQEPKVIYDEKFISFLINLLTNQEKNITHYSINKEKRQKGTAQKVLSLGLLCINFILNSKIKHHCSVKIKGLHNFF